MEHCILKKDKKLFFGKTKKINKSRINSYWKFLILASISITIFGSIDTLMLGKFVDLEYLGFYRVSLSLIITLSSLFSLSGIFLPVFTQIHGKRFKRGFEKTVRYILLFSIPSAIGILFIGRHLIKLIYGSEYLLGASSLYLLIPIVITAPLTALYSMVFNSKEKPKIVSNALLVSLITNILLNVLAIFLFKDNPLLMIAGVALSTSLSRILYLEILRSRAKSEFNFTLMGKGIRKPLFASLVMALLLASFNYFIDINLIYGAIEVLLGAGVYFLVLYWIKGITKKDIGLLKSLFLDRFKQSTKNKINLKNQQKH